MCGITADAAVEDAQLPIAVPVPICGRCPYACGAGAHMCAVPVPICGRLCLQMWVLGDHYYDYFCTCGCSLLHMWVFPSVFIPAVPMWVYS